MKYGQECVATELSVTVQTGITTLGERKETGSLCQNKIYAYLWSFLGAYNNRNVCFSAFEKILTIAVFLTAQNWELPKFLSKTG